MYIEKVLDICVQLMKNGGKNTRVAFIIFVSVCMYIYIYIYTMRRHVHKLQWKCNYQINSAICKEKLCDFDSADNMTGKLNKPPNRSHNTTSLRNLGVIFDDQLTFKDHIAKTARSYRFCIAQHQKDQALPYTARRTTSLSFLY